MAGTARIEELQKKFDENPRRYFAPLANEYRKVGDIDQAIAICQEYLPQQPGHMSGHIVYGQALFEARRFDDARAVFETALSLDPENLIALRHLGDISREGGDPAAARAWYQRVLDADPRNEEIAVLISDLDAMPASSAMAPTPLSTPVVSMSPMHDQPAVTLSDQPTVEIPRMGGAPVRPSEPVVEYPLESEPEESGLPTFDLSTADTAETVVPPAPPTSRALPPMPEPEDIPLELPSEIFEPTSYQQDASNAPPPAADFRLSHAIESAAGVEPAAHDEPTAHGRASIDGLVPTEFEDPGALAGLEPTSFDDRASANTAVGSAGLASAFETELSEPASALHGAHDAPAATPAQGSSVDLPFITDEEGEPTENDEHPAPRHTPSSPAFVTETMAELYLRQGHRTEAIEVYRQLVAQRPGDSALRTRLDEVEHGVASGARGPSIRDFLGALAMRKPSGWDETDADDNGAPPHDELAQPQAAPRASAPVMGRPSEPRGSIDALFPGRDAPPTDAAAAERLAQAFAGDDVGARDEAALAGAPARTATTELSLDHVFRERGATPVQGQPSFSFDQFFAQGAAAHDDPAVAERSSGTGGAPDDDIQQFNDWLEGLKKS